MLRALSAALFVAVATEATVARMLEADDEGDVQLEEPCMCPMVHCGDGQKAELIPGTENDCCGGRHRCVDDPNARPRFIEVGENGCHLSEGDRWCKREQKCIGLKDRAFDLDKDGQVSKEEMLHGFFRRCGTYPDLDLDGVDDKPEFPEKKPKPEPAERPERVRPTGKGKGKGKGPQGPRDCAAPTKWCTKLKECMIISESGFDMDEDGTVTEDEFEAGCQPPPRMCCRAFTPMCMACAKGITVEEYCAQKYMPGCPDPKELEPPKEREPRQPASKPPTRGGKVGADTDKNGCKRSAGFVFCAANKNCIRPSDSLFLDTNNDKKVSEAEFKFGCRAPVYDTPDKMEPKELPTGEGSAEAADAKPMPVPTTKQAAAASASASSFKAQSKGARDRNLHDLPTIVGIFGGLLLATLVGIVGYRAYRRSLNAKASSSGEHQNILRADAEEGEDEPAMNGLDVGEIEMEEAEGGEGQVVIHAGQTNQATDTLGQHWGATDNDL